MASRRLSSPCNTCQGHDIVRADGVSTLACGVHNLSSHLTCVRETAVNPSSRAVPYAIGKQLVFAIAFGGLFGLSGLLSVDSLGISQRIGAESTSLFGPAVAGLRFAALGGKGYLLAKALSHLVKAVDAFFFRTILRSLEEQHDSLEDELVRARSDLEGVENWDRMRRHRLEIKHADLTKRLTDVESGVSEVWKRIWSLSIEAPSFSPKSTNPDKKESIDE